MNSLRRSSLAVAPSAIAPHVKPAARKRTILVADDNTDNRDMMQMLLGLKGYDVIVATDGPEAVRIALAQLPDLILLDLELPCLDGLAVAEQLRRRAGFNSVPIVMVSGHDPRKHRQQALDAGCTDYLFKPIDFERLDEILDETAPLDGRAGEV